MKNSSLAFGSALAVVSLLGTFTLANAQDQPTPNARSPGPATGLSGCGPITQTGSAVTSGMETRNHGGGKNPGSR